MFGSVGRDRVRSIQTPDSILSAPAILSTVYSYLVILVANENQLFTRPNSNTWFILILFILIYFIIALTEWQ